METVEQLADRVMLQLEQSWVSFCDPRIGRLKISVFENSLSRGIPMVDIMEQFLHFYNVHRSSNRNDFLSFMEVKRDDDTYFICLNYDYSFRPLNLNWRDLTFNGAPIRFRRRFVRRRFCDMMIGVINRIIVLPQSQPVLKWWQYWKRRKMNNHRFKVVWVGEGHRHNEALVRWHTGSVYDDDAQGYGTTWIRSLDDYQARLPFFRHILMPVEWRLSIVVNLNMYLVPELIDLVIGFLHWIKKTDTYYLDYYKTFYVNR